MNATRSAVVAAVRWALAGLTGYAVIVALTILGLEVWLRGADLYTGRPTLQALGLLVAVVAGLTGGAAAAVIGGSRPLRHAAAVLPLLIVDTTYVVFFFDDPAPWWFDLGGGVTLVVATLAAGGLVARLRTRAARPSRPPV